MKLWTASTKTKARLQGPMIRQRLSGQPFQAFKHWAKDDEWLRSEQRAKELLTTKDSAEFFGNAKMKSSLHVSPA